MTTIFIGFFISGIGSSFFHSFGIPYMDDNMSKNKSPGERILSDLLYTSAGRSLPGTDLREPDTGPGSGGGAGQFLPEGLCFSGPGERPD